MKTFLKKKKMKSLKFFMNTNLIVQNMFQTKVIQNNSF